MKSFRELNLYKSIHPYWREIKKIYFLLKSKRTDYLHPEELSQINYLYTGDSQWGKMGNYAFGNYRVLKKYFGKSLKRNCMIEHGVYFGRYVLTEECTMDGDDTIYTYSEYRKNAIEERFKGKLNRNILVIGPYIQYAANFKCKSSLVKLKGKLGKVLLVFPSHGYPSTEVIFSEEYLLSCIDKIAAEYNSVLVSLNGYDIACGKAELYRKKGYIIVSSGNRMDQFFLNRQRDLIELSDMTISNDIGTCIGYCICLGKPHYIINQGTHSVDSETNKSSDSTTTAAYRKVEYDEIYDAFSIKDHRIYRKQIDVVKKYWGPFDESRINIVE